MVVVVVVVVVGVWLKGKHQFIGNKNFTGRFIYFNKTFIQLLTFIVTVDGRIPANQLRLVVDPIISRVLYIPDGA